MNDNECNRVIAEFMGYKLVGGKWYVETTFRFHGTPLKKRDSPHDGEITRQELVDTSFTKSLDALVPVWEKLDSVALSVCKRANKSWDFGSNFNRTIFRHDIGETIQQAAAHATAKAIQELSK